MKRYKLTQMTICIGVFLVPISVMAARKNLEKPALRLSDRGAIKVIRNDDTGDFILRWKPPGGQPTEVVLVPASKVDVVVSATVEGSDDRGRYIYRYKLENGKSSRQRLQQFIVEFSGAAIDLESPEDWRSSALSFHSALSWSDVKYDARGVLGADAGAVLEGFSFKSFGHSGFERFTDRVNGKPGIFFRQATLPGIVRCWARGHTEVLKLSGEGPEDLDELLPRVLDDAVKGLTVGPVPIPEPFEPIGFVALLTKYLHESLAQGWIESQAEVMEAEEALGRLRQALEKKDYRLAESLVDQAARALSKKRTFTSEATALLTFNLDYLQRQITNLRRRS